MADRHVLYKLAAKEIAARAGRSLTFMAKFDESLAGSSLHVHASLWTRGDEPAFAGARALAGTPRHELGRVPPLPGRAARARARGRAAASRPIRTRTSATAPAPSRRRGIAWSYDNRTAGFRVVGEGASLRVECRIPGADANPYLVYAALLAAGLDGIERATRAGPGLRGRRLRRRGSAAGARARCPRPTRAFEASAFARRAFGDAVVGASAPLRAHRAAPGRARASPTWSARATSSGSEPDARSPGSGIPATSARAGAPIATRSGGLPPPSRAQRGAAAWSRRRKCWRSSTAPPGTSRRTIARTCRTGACSSRPSAASRCASSSSCGCACRGAAA